MVRLSITGNAMYLASYLFIGWNHCIHEDNLTLYKLASTETGPVVGLSLMVKADYSWVVSYRNEMVSPVNCVLLQSTPTFIGSGKILLLIEH